MALKASRNFQKCVVPALDNYSSRCMYTCPKQTQKSADFFLKTRGPRFYLKMGPRTLLWNSPANFRQVERSYELFPDVSTLTQRGHLSACANVEIVCGSMVSPWAIWAKTYVVEGEGCAGYSACTAFSSSCTSQWCRSGGITAPRQ